MNPFFCTEHEIAANIKVTILDVEHLDGNVKKILDEKFVLICEGASCSSLDTVKKLVKNLYSSKDKNWIMGATSEFFVHLYISLSGFKQECLFLNLEEGSIKKGFDGYYSQEDIEWLMESKSGSIESKGIRHSDKIKLAMSDLEGKVLGKTKAGDKKNPNNPWRNAYSHANSYDVGTSDKIRKNIKKLSDDFTNGIFYTMDKFNVIPCGTIFLSGVWNPPCHQNILAEIKAIASSLKGKQIHVICVTHKSVHLFLHYIGI